jgi:hypothetical protein
MQSIVIILAAYTSTFASSRNVFSEMRKNLGSASRSSEA